MHRASDDLLALLRVIEENTVRTSAAGRETARIGPFVAVAHPTNELVWLSHAIPLSAERGRGDVPAVLPELRAWFAARNRRLRFEILEPLWPDLEPQLAVCGVELQGRMPLMVCGPADLRPAEPPAGVTIEPIDAGMPDAVQTEFVSAAHRSFGEPGGQPLEQSVKDHRTALAEGRYRSAAAWHDGRIVGVGSLTVGNDELVGIGTLPEHRRRGIAAAISRCLVADHFARGGAVAWLSAGDDAARRVYQRIGFRVVGDQVNMMDPAPVARATSP